MAPAITMIAARLAPVKKSEADDHRNGPRPGGERQRQGIEGLIDQAGSWISLVGVFHALVTTFLKEAPSGEGNDNAARCPKDRDRDSIEL
jgi:hypothetical protein